VAAVAVAGLPTRWSNRTMVAGPLAMAAGLLGIALFMTAQPVAVLPPLIVLTGLGIGICWVFGVQGIMSGAVNPPIAEQVALLREYYGCDAIKGKVSAARFKALCGFPADTR